MSKKISIAAVRKACGYELKPHTCGNCAQFASELQLSGWMERRNSGMSEDSSMRYTVEKNGIECNRRCTLHNFAVKKMATCRDWQAKE
jgi:hypothetical protein